MVRVFAACAAGAAKDAAAEELKKVHAAEKKKLEQEVARINTALRFLKLEHRVAREGTSRMLRD